MRHAGLTATLAALALLAACADAPTVAPAPTPDGPVARPAGEEFTGYVLAWNGQPLEVRYTVLDGWAYQDDMGFGPAAEMAATPQEALERARPPAAAEGGPQFTMYGGQGVRWPGGVLYYEFDGALPPDRLDAAQRAVNHINSFSGTTGVSMVRGTNGGRYFRVVPTTGMARVSNIGYRARTDTVFLNTAIWQVAVHEFGHALGLWHEHQRCERDAYLIMNTNSGNFQKRCDLPTMEPYNTWSIMHYSPGEIGSNGSFRAGVSVPPAKSLHPGLVDSDLRSLATIYSTSGTFSQVSLMHGRCLDAPSPNNGTPVHMWDCVGNANQRWTYYPNTGELKVHGNKCLDGWAAQRLNQVVVHDCHGGGNQKWDIGSHGEIVLRGILDEAGRPLCADIANLDRSLGARLLLQYCHRGDNQLWRRSPGGGGSATVSVVTDLATNRCMDAQNSNLGTQLYIWDCLGPNHPNQRFTRTFDRELRILGRCVDGDAGTAGAPVKVWDCHGGGNQKWDLTPSGELKGVNGLCIAVNGAATAPGTLLYLRACTNGREQLWSYRDPR